MPADTDTGADADDVAALQAQVASLTRRAARERSARQQAELIGEETTARLYAVVRQLQQAQSLIDRTTDLVVMIDGTGRVTYANAAARRRLAPADSSSTDHDDDGAFSAGALTGVDAREVVTEASYRRWVDHAQPAVTATGFWHGDLELLAGTGEVIAASAVVLAQPASATSAAGWSLVARDVTAERELQRQLQHRADHDPLTGLGNRARFFAALQQALDEMAAQRGPRTDVLGVLFVDLDGFKGVNDTWGHEVGDHLLQQVAQSVSGCLRTQDVVCRLGGDEFTAVLPHLESPEDAERVARRVLAAVTGPVVDGVALPTAASVGVATCSWAAADPRPGRDVDGPGSSRRLSAAELLQRADHAMYEAKRSGRGRCAVAAPVELVLRAAPRGVVEPV